MENAGNDDELAAARVYCGYGDALHAYQAVDFDDLIVVPVALFERDEDTRARWQARCAHVLIYEYQDTNAAQYRLFRHLVGDGHQAIPEKAKLQDVEFLHNGRMPSRSMITLPLASTLASARAVRPRAT